jgi:hypothetical protein
VSSRPRSSPPYELPDALAEVVGLLALAAQVAFVWVTWPILPATLPIHFGLDGAADGFGGREWILLPVAVALILYTGLSLVSRFPWAFNFPWPVTVANAPRLYRISRRMVLWLKAELTLIFGYLTWSMARSATTPPGGLDSWFHPVALGLVLGTIALGVFAMRPATWDRA